MVKVTQNNFKCVNIQFKNYQTSHYWHHKQIEANLTILYAQTNGFFCSETVLIADTLVKPTHQELKFPFGKVGKRLSESFTDNWYNNYHKHNKQ